MALLSLESFDKISKNRNTIHKKTQTNYLIFEVNGEKYLQIDTYGSNDRKFKNKVSQSIQIDKQVAVELVALLSKTFDL